MKTLILVFFFLWSTTSLGAQLDPEVTKGFDQIKRTYQGGSNGGAAVVGTYNIRTFSVEEQIDDLLRKAGRDFRGRECGREIAVGRTKNLEDLAVNRTEFAISKGHLKILNDLYKMGKLKTMISSTYNGEGEAENCAVFEMRIFANDGQVLILVADYTT